MLQISGVSKEFRRGERAVRALDRVSLSVKPGEFVVVCGPSGSGKTTLLLLAGGLLAPDDGRVQIDGRDPYTLSPDPRADFRAENLGFVFQQFHLIPYLSVAENILSAALARVQPGARDYAVQLIERLGLSERADHTPSELSVGERQRTALARAMLNRPRLILADEPTGNLDDANAAEVLSALGEFAEAGGAVLVVTHDPKSAVHAHRTVRLERGSIVSA